MPASNIDLYHMQDARNNFDAMRPAPVCADANQFMGQCQNIHISTNCYYGFHEAKSSGISHVTTDCEMLEAPHANSIASPQSNIRKRRADEIDYPLSKRHREAEVQRERNIEPETSENKISDKDTEDLLETLYWNIHGGNMFHISQLYLCL